MEILQGKSLISHGESGSADKGFPGEAEENVGIKWQKSSMRENQWEAFQQIIRKVMTLSPLYAAFSADTAFVFSLAPVIDKCAH